MLSHLGEVVGGVPVENHPAHLPAETTTTTKTKKKTHTQGKKRVGAKSEKKADLGVFPAKSSQQLV